MKRLAAFLIFLLAGAIVPAGMVRADQQPVATFQVVAGQTWTKEIPGAIVNWTGEFDYSKDEGWGAAFAVYFTETGHKHGVTATEKGFVDADGKYIWILKDVQTQDNPETKELATLESWHQLVVKFIDPLSGKVVVDNDFNGKTYTLHVGDEIDVSGEISDASTNEKTVLELKGIETGLFGSKAVLVLHHITALSGTVEIYPYNGQTPEPGTSPSPPEKNQTTNETAPQKPFIDPTKVPAVMIVVGEHAAGADVAAGAKVGIAVQKMLDRGKAMAEVGLAAIGVNDPRVIALLEGKLTADAMLDTEVTDPNKIAPVVYSVGGPVANQYTAMLNERKDLPVRFVKKEDGKWYLVSKYGDIWSGSYGVIEIIPAARTMDEAKEHLLQGDFKQYDIIVAGLDRKGTYAACELLNQNFLALLNGGSIQKELAPVLLPTLNSLGVFEGFISMDQTTALAIILDENGEIVKVVAG